MAVTGQLDLFDDQDVDECEQEQAWRARLQLEHEAARRVDCCTGLPLARGERLDDDGRVLASWPQMRCGRCGQIAARGRLDTSHDLGYCGCPGWDYQTPGYQHVDITRDRHDQQHHVACTCGHPWGLHGWPGQARELNPCLAYCGCDGYVSVTR